MTHGWAAGVMDFWFGLQPEQWWTADEELDAAIRGRFAELHEELRQLPATGFLSDARTALAAVILFDQFPRNMFRGHADQFATDHVALQIAEEAVDREYDDELARQQRGFLYMPFMHSEDLSRQKRSVQLFTALGDDHQLGFARKHHDVIERFGRFPHRNAMLGRSPRAEEVAAGNVVPW